MNTLTLNEVEEKIIQIRGKYIILDSDVAQLYGVETKRINEAVKNNPEKFPEGYILDLLDEELDFLRSKFSTAKFSKTRTLPKAFTERGLYMLATILKSPMAIQTTIVIVDTFAKMREFSRAINQLPEIADEMTQQTLLEKSEKILNELLGSGLNISDTETSLEFNLGLMKVKHLIKRKK